VKENTHFIEIKGLERRNADVARAGSRQYNRCNKMATNRTHSAVGDSEESQAGRKGVWTIPNVLTVFRIILTLPFLYFVNQGRFGYALLVFFGASVTDFVDGYIARRFKQQSKLGRFLDPLADKVLTTTGFVVMAIPHSGFPSIPIWLAVAVVGRDAIIVLGSLVVYRLTKFRDFKPTLLGKINTLVELGLIVWFLVFHTTGRLIFLLPSLYVIVLATLVLSGFEYVVEGIHILRRDRKGSSEAVL
jgi:cardiolipin synthase